MPSDQIKTIIQRLYKHYPDATYELDWETPEQMLVGTTLAAQCTDERVNRVTKTLFKKYPSPKAFADANSSELEQDLKPTGFFRQKTRSVQTINRALVERFGGKIPPRMEDLLTIKGVARKTANVVLNVCFDIPSGIIVDTHVARLSQRMGFTTQKKPEKIEKDLMKVVPKDEWTFWGPAMVLHGRHVCKSKKPACDRCIFLDVCPRAGVAGARPTKTSPPPMVTCKGSPSMRITKLKEAAKGGAAKGGVTTNGSASITATPLQTRWLDLLQGEMEKSYFDELISKIAKERETEEVFPPEEEVFSAFTLTPFEQVKVFILGQDPYHDNGQAHGLSFSVKPGISLPPSVRNIFKELKSDLGIVPPKHGYLVDWAAQGVMMINAVLTVRAHKPNSHAKMGWENFTDEVIRQLSQEQDHVVFLLWGRFAQKKAKLINTSKHTVIKATHPSPLSASRGFFGSKPFSKINAALREAGQEEIDWKLSE